MKIIFAILPVSVIFLTFQQPAAWGWGSYGHEQVNRGAVQLLGSSTDVGACMTKNKSIMERLAITPDYDWKNLGTKPSFELQGLRLQTDKYEHPHHFFEADDFINPPADAAKIQALPSGLFEQAYAKGSNGLLTLFFNNEATMRAVNPAKFDKDPDPVKNVDAADPTPEGVAGAAGSAPWRIYQLYTTAIDTWAKEGNPELALVYLGAMGHYVGDMSQPFHASANFDGHYYRGRYYDDKKDEISPTEGIHHTFEEAILEMAYVNHLTLADQKSIAQLLFPFCQAHTPQTSFSKDDKTHSNPTQLTTKQWQSKVKSCVREHIKKADPTNDLWDSLVANGFDATDVDVMGFLKSKNPKDIPTNDVVKEVLNLIASGYGTIDPLLDVFCKATNPGAAGSVCGTGTNAKNEKANSRKVAQAETGGTAKPARQPRATSGDTGENTPVRNITDQMTTDFMKATMPGSGETILVTADRRLADAAYLLASLWKSAFARIKEANANAAPCGVIFGNDLKTADNYNALLTEAIKNYPWPHYIPAYKDVGFKEGRVPQSAKKKK